MIECQHFLLGEWQILSRVSMRILVIIRSLCQLKNQLESQAGYTQIDLTLPLSGGAAVGSGCSLSRPRIL